MIGGWSVLRPRLSGLLALRRLPTVTGAALTLVALGEVCRVQWWLFRPVPHQMGFDEAYLAAFADRMIQGHWLPYVDAVSHRGPMLYWATAVAQWLGGSFGWAGIRWLGLLSMLATCLGCFAGGVAARRPFAGGTAALFFAYAILLAFPPDGGLEFTGESLATPFVVAAVVLVAVALRAPEPRTREGALGGAGAAAALGALTKQTAILGIIPLIIWILASFSQLPLTRRERLRSWAALLGGSLLPFACVLTKFAYHKQVPAFVYWFYTYNAKVYMEPYRGTSLVNEVGGLIDKYTLFSFGVVLIVVWGLFVIPLARLQHGGGGLSRLLAAYAARGFEVTVAAQAVVALLPAVLAMRYWAHYFIPVLPWVGFAIGLVLEGSVGLIDRLAPASILFVGGAALAGYVHVALAQRVDTLARAQMGSPHQTDPICSEIDAHSRPDERIFIWGFDGDLYLTCQRHPASRFVFTTMVAGIVPPFWNEQRTQRVAPRAQETLIHDIEESHAPLVLDCPRHMGGVSMHQIPMLGHYLDEEYCPLPAVIGTGDRIATPYVRKPDAGCATVR
jgi:hypothetical protein